MDAQHLFENFEVTLIKEKTGAYISRAECGDGTTQTLPFHPPRLNRNPSSIQGNAYRGISTRRQGGPSQGEALFSSLFQGTIRDAFIRRKQVKRLRIVLRLPDDPDLHHLPWERMKHHQSFLAREVHFSLVRGLPGHYRTDVTPENPPKMLLAWAQPGDRNPLAVEKEAQQIQAVVPKHWILDVLANATAQTFQEQLTKGYDLVHFMGHGSGSQAAIDLTDNQGNAQILDSASMCDILLGVQRDQLPQVIVFNACYGGSVHRQGLHLDGMAKRLIAHGIPNVVAMMGPIQDAHALTFSHHFFKALALGKVLDEAVTLGRRAIPHDQAWHLPTLFSSAMNQPWCIPKSSSPSQPPNKQGQTKVKHRFKPWLFAAPILLLLGLFWLFWPGNAVLLAVSPTQLQSDRSPYEWLPVSLPLALEGERYSHRVQIHAEDRQLSYQLEDRDGEVLWSGHNFWIPSKKPLITKAYYQLALAKCLREGMLLQDANLRTLLVEMLVKTSEACMDGGEIEAARALLFEAEETQPQGTASVNLAVLYLQEGNQEQARSWAEKAVSSKVDPLNHYALAAALEPFDPQGARSLLERVVLEAPLFLHAQHLLGRVHQSLGDTQVARSKFLNVLEKDPTYGAAYHALADLHIAAENWQEALSHLKDAARHSPLQQLDLQTEILEKKVQCLRHLDKKAQAQSLEQVLWHFPETHISKNRHSQQNQPHTSVLLWRGGITVEGQPLHHGQILASHQRLLLPDETSELMLYQRGQRLYFQGPDRFTLEQASERAIPYQYRRWITPFKGDVRIIPPGKGGTPLTVLLPRGKTRPKPDICWIPDPKATHYTIKFFQEGFREGTTKIPADRVTIETWFPQGSTTQVARVSWPFPEVPIFDEPQLEIIPNYAQGESGETPATLSFVWDPDPNRLVQRTNLDSLIAQDDWANVFQVLNGKQTTPIQLAETLLQANDPHLAIENFEYALAQQLSGDQRGRALWGLGRALTMQRSFNVALKYLRQARVIYARNHHVQAVEAIDLTIGLCHQHLANSETSTNLKSP